MHRKQILYRNDKTLLWNLQPKNEVAATNDKDMQTKVHNRLKTAEICTYSDTYLLFCRESGSLAVTAIAPKNFQRSPSNLQAFGKG